MRSGKLDRTIEIRRAVLRFVDGRPDTDRVDENGVPSPRLQQLHKLRTELIEARTDGIEGDAGYSSERHVTFRIRYVAGLSITDTLVFEGKIFEIKQIVEIGRRRGLDLVSIGGCSDAGP